MKLKAFIKSIVRGTRLYSVAKAYQYGRPHYLDR